MSDTYNSIGAGGGADNFVELNDVPASYSGEANKFVRVKGTEDGLEFVAGGVGESNTASNVGVGGVGVFKVKSGVDLQFKNINAGSSKISVTNDAVNNEIDIDVVQANLSITESQISDLGTTVLLTSDIGSSVQAYDATILVDADIGVNVEAYNANIQSHVTATSGNPHNVTKSDVGLGNVDNTSDANKPISTATQTALDAKQSFTEATVSTTDATPTTLVDIAIATDTRKQIKVYANGFETATGDTIWKEITLGCKNIAGTVSIIGSPVANTGYDAGASAWTIIASVSTTNIRITVTGENTHSIDWAARIEVR